MLVPGISGRIRHKQARGCQISQGGYQYKNLLIKLFHYTCVYYGYKQKESTKKKKKYRP
jgi:hypothetical protein